MSDPVYRCLFVERPRDGKLRIELFMMRGSLSDDGVLVNGEEVSPEGWHDSEWAAVRALADQIEERAEEWIDGAAALRESV